MDNLIKDKTLKIVKWKAKSNVTDSEITYAVSNMVQDLNQLKGFVSHTLYKTDYDEWVDINYWDTVEDANNSNGEMLEKTSFTKLIKLIDVSTVNVDILDAQD
ncbi:hypothetical protein MNBD_GAMMA22-1196 [hydrothermal vent metagenome]|uniref:ABM domain-containing protein n=1 Tax=hydrothermal vent metagenome TaxID=652676 RepID=A0A3B1A261_9ZZZZ